MRIWVNANRPNFANQLRRFIAMYLKSQYGWAQGRVKQISEWLMGTITNADLLHCSKRVRVKSLAPQWLRQAVFSA
jgi:hypothetical protein